MKANFQLENIENKVVFLFPAKVMVSLKITNRTLGSQWTSR